MIEPLLPHWAAPARVRAMVTTRAGGVSGGPWRSLNLGLRCGDDAEAVRENRKRLGARLPAAPAWLRQVHGTRTLVVDGAPAAGDEPEADAAVTARAGTVCAVLVADCLPVLLADRDGTAVGAAHAGWRGLAAGVIESAVAAMPVPPARLLAWLGPAIGPRVYEVGEEVRAAFLAADEGCEEVFTATRPGHWRLDLYAAARRRLRRCGVGDVTGGGLCVHTDAERFFSYRRDRRTGRMAALIWLE